MGDPWSAKLANGSSLDAADRSALARIVRTAFEVGAHRDLIREGDKPHGVHLVVDGFVCRYKVGGRLRRRITAWMLPGDVCDPQVGLLDRMDHSIGTLAPSRVAFVPTRIMDALADRYPNIRRALAWNVLVDEAILRVWLANATLQAADKRIAHLFCELHTRLRSIGHADAAGFSLLIGQAQLAESAGLSVEHVNRTLADLQTRGLLRVDRREVSFPDLEALQAFAGFDPNYLHLTSADSVTQRAPTRRRSSRQSPQI